MVEKSLEPHRKSENHAFGPSLKQFQNRKGIPPQIYVQKTVGLQKQGLDSKEFETLVLVGNS